MVFDILLRETEKLEFWKGSVMCSQWRKYRQNYDISVSVYSSAYDLSLFYSSVREHSVWTDLHQCGRYGSHGTSL